MKRILFLIILVTSALGLHAQVSVEAMIDSIQILVGQQAHVTLTAVAKENSKVEFPQFKPTQMITPGWRFWALRSWNRSRRITDS